MCTVGFGLFFMDPAPFLVLGASLLVVGDWHVLFTSCMSGHVTIETSYVRQESNSSQIEAFVWIGCPPPPFAPGSICLALVHLPHQFRQAALALVPFLYWFRQADLALVRLTYGVCCNGFCPISSTSW